MKKQLLIRELLIEKWIEPSYVSKSGNMYWYNEYGNLHSTGDRPAMKGQDGSKWWYKNGQIHRDGENPAAIHSNGKMFWYKNGKYIKANF